MTETTSPTFVGTLFSFDEGGSDDYATRDCVKNDNNNNNDNNNGNNMNTKAQNGNVSNANFFVKLT